MKKIFWLLPLLMWQSVVAQQAIYTIDVNGDILTNSQFIDPFFCEDQNTPYEQMYSETLPLPAFGKSCTLRLYNYRGRYRAGLLSDHRRRDRRSPGVTDGAFRRMGQV